MLAIKNNLMAENAARHLGKSYNSLAKSVERLSSGLRINGAKDDAAGLAVRELMRADIAVLRQGSRNAQDGVSMLQTAEGSMGVIDDLLIRMKELAEQAATASYSSDQRSIMNAEYTQLANEITRIANSTSFNGIQMLSSSATHAIHIGTTTTIDIATEKMDATSLNVDVVTGSKTNALFTTAVADGSTEYIAAADLDTDNQFINLQFGGSAITVDLMSYSAAGISLNMLAAEINDKWQDTYSTDEVASVVATAAGTYQLKLEYHTNSAAAFTVNSLADAIDLFAASAAGTSWTDTTGAADSTIDLTTAAGATSALALIATAINTKDSYRAKLGYMMNRLEAAVSILNIQTENLMTSESRISDVDVATEMAAMTRNQVLSQAGISMLTQANAMPQMALSLLR